MEPIRILAPFSDEIIASLRSGDRVLISGTLIAARDAAHMRMHELIAENLPLPLDLVGQVFYYVGPSPAPPGRAMGSAGPTTSGRLDRYTPSLLKKGLRGMIGKGYRSPEVKEALVQHHAVYLAATGGTGALLSRCIVSSRILVWEDLGPEAIRELTVVDFPAVVIHDIYGGDQYRDGQQDYRDRHRVSQG